MPKRWVLSLKGALLMVSSSVESANLAFSDEASDVVSDQIGICIVYVSKPMIRGVLKKELKKSGVSVILVAETVQEAIDRMKEHPTAMLALDWELGEANVALVLKVAQGRYKIDTRPIYFLSAHNSEKLLSIASDYNVSQVHVGEITPKNIKEEVAIVVGYLGQSPRCRQVFREVARLRAERRWRKAESLLAALMREEPSNVRAGVELGENYYQTGDLTRSRRILDQMLEIDPTNLRAQHMLARVLMKQGRSSEALEILKEVENQGILNIDRMVDIGYCLLDLDRYNEALMQFNSALQVAPESRKAKIGKSQAYLFKGKLNQAMKLIHEVSDKKELASIFNNSAILCMRQRKYDKGIELYRHAITQVGNDREILSRLIFNLGIGYFKGRSFKKAMLAFGEVVDINPKFKKAKHNIVRLGQMSPDLGELAEALIKHDVERVKQIAENDIVEIPKLEDPTSDVMVDVHIDAAQLPHDDTEREKDRDEKPHEI
jgi:tetratricopeptide (TPR) repeat protein